MKNLFNNELGFSLVQGMIIAGVVAGSGLVATRLITDQKLAQKGAETRDQIEDLHNQAYATLQNRDNCDATITGNGLTGTILTDAALPAGITLPSIRSASAANPVVLQVHDGGVLRASEADIAAGTNNSYMNGNVIVTRMNLRYIPADGKARLEITYERLSRDENKRSKSGYGAKEIKKVIDLRIQRNPFNIAGGKPFESCYGVTAAKVDTDAIEQGNDINRELCQQMSGVNSDGSITGASVFAWDETTSTCLPNAKCPAHQVYMGITADGKVICERLQDAVDASGASMGDYIAPTPGTDTCGAGKTVSFEKIAGNKVRIRCL